MPSPYVGLNPRQVMALMLEMESRQVCVDLHDYIGNVRTLVAGENIVSIPDSHKAIGVSANHEGGLALGERIEQGAAWLSSANLRFSVVAGSYEERDEARKQERFARAGEKRLARGGQLHRWRQEANRDLFEGGISVVQHHADAGYYSSTSPEKMKAGARIEEVYWRRRVDPLDWYWAEDNRGNLAASMMAGKREVGQVARIASREAFGRLASYFDWAETPIDDYRSRAGVATVRVTELLLPDFGYLIVRDSPTARRASGGNRELSPDNADRIVARWRTNWPRIPHYVTFTGKWPPASPLDRMVQLTALRDWYATMQDVQGAGGAFRHWMLVDDASGESLADSLWRDAVPEHILLDLSQPPPSMGPGKRWELAPFQFIPEINARYLQIKADHEAAGASVARLMGNLVGPHTPVGTADQMEDFARREFSDLIDSYGGTVQAIWEDTFRHLRDHHKDRVVVAARTRASAERDGAIDWFSQRLELSGSEVVSEDIEVTVDTRSRLSLVADYSLGRMMQNEGDIGYERRVEQGVVPFVDDAEEEKAAITVDGIENMLLEQQATEVVRQAQQNAAAPDDPPRPMTVTRGAGGDPRGSGVGAGPLNIANTQLQAGQQALSA